MGLLRRLPAPNDNNPRTFRPKRRAAPLTGQAMKKRRINNMQPTCRYSVDRDAPAQCLTFDHRPRVAAATLAVSKKMKHILLIILTFLAIKTYGFTAHFDSLRTTFQTCTTFSEFTKSLDKRYSSFTIGGKNERLTRQLDFDFKQIVFEIEVNYGQSYYEEYRVFLVTKNDSIVLGTLQELNYYQKVKRSTHFQVLDSALQQYLHQHASVYGKKLSQKDFIQQLRGYPENQVCL